MHAVLYFLYLLHTIEQIVLSTLVIPSVIQPVMKKWCQCNRRCSKHFELCC